MVDLPRPPAPRRRGRDISHHAAPAWQATTPVRGGFRDEEVVGAACATAVHLGRRDALFRTRRPPGALGRVLPELVHRYPTFRFDIARGRVAGAERDLARRIAEQVDALAAGSDAEVVLCPLGVGRHVDHVLVRSAGAGSSDRLLRGLLHPGLTRQAPQAIESSTARRHRPSSASRWTGSMCGCHSAARRHWLRSARWSDQ
jgi:hypothetical protein